MFRVSCLVKNRWPRLAVALPGNAGGPVNLFRCLRLRHGSGITGPEKRLFSPDAKHAGAEKTRLKGFSTNRHQTGHGKSRVSCLVFRENLVAGHVAGADGSRLVLTDLSRLPAAGRHFASPRGEKCRSVFSFQFFVFSFSFFGFLRPRADYASSKHAERRHGCLIRAMFRVRFSSACLRIMRRGGQAPRGHPRAPRGLLRPGVDPARGTLRVGVNAA